MKLSLGILLPVFCIFVQCVNCFGEYYEDFNDVAYNFPDKYEEEPVPEADVYNPEPMPIVDRRKRQANDIIDICNRENCRFRGNGVRALEPCGQAFCTCVNGYSYLQGCGHGLVYDIQRRVCNFPQAVAGC